ncbi:MAG: squalene/phytoene synthase family protein [Pseudomonadota bacterium]
MTENLADLYPKVHAGTDSAALVTAITKQSGTSFGAGMRILPATRRAGMHAVYAFCRLVDDIADGPWSAADKHHALDAWRDEVAAIYRKAPQSSVGEALLPHIAQFDLPQAEFLALIDGMAMDADGPIIAPRRSVLSLYTRRVAGTVGALSIRVFGAWQGEESDRFALALGDALQLTNIIRDVEEDAAIGRLYLPQELLADNGLREASPTEVAASDRLPRIREALGNEAKALYDEARALAPLHRRKPLRAALMMMGAYEGYLERIEALGWQLDPEKPLMPKWMKLTRGLRYAAFGPGSPEGPHS